MSFQAEKTEAGYCRSTGYATGSISLDEPTSELDPVGRSEIYAVVDRLRRHGNLTVLAVEHSSEDIAMRADEVLVINDGKVVWQGGATAAVLQCTVAAKCGRSATASVGVRMAAISTGFD